jgi:hypothetical protein
MSQRNNSGWLGRLLRDPIMQGLAVIVAILAIVVTIILSGVIPRVSSSFEVHPCSNGGTPRPALPSSAAFVEEKDIQVPANKLWFDTNIQVQKRDFVEFTATGYWYSGISTTDPDGDCGLGLSACGECPVVGGNLGELVGKVGDGTPFRIGSSSLQVIDQAGNLLLAMNDNTGTCNIHGRIRSCYDDNTGTLEVIVTIRRIK